MKKTTSTLLLAISTVILLSSCGNLAEKQMDAAEQQVIKDALEQYEIVKQTNDEMEMYSHASFVKAAYLQAKDSVNYKKWDAIEKVHGQNIGIE